MRTPACIGIFSVIVVSSTFNASGGLATPPGVNGLLVFQKRIGANTQLFTMRPNGSGLHRLTHGALDSEFAAWSPDGKTIAFDRVFLTHSGIFLMRADGGGLRSLTPSGQQESPTFTPDGRWIVFARAPSSLWVMDLEGARQRQLTHPPPSSIDESPSVAPDGKLVVFSRAQSETRSALFVISLDGRRLRRITPWGIAAVGNLDWAPDGSRILFHTNSQRSQIHTIRPNGTGLRTLTSGTRNYCSGSFSPEGTQILLVDNCNSDANTNLYSMRANGGALTRVPKGHGVHRVSWGRALG